jgi:hypothetical protein
MAGASDIGRILSYAILLSVLVLAWAYIPA